MKSRAQVKKSFAILGLCGFLLTGVNTMAGLIAPGPEKVPCAVADRQDFQIPDRVQLTG